SARSGGEAENRAGGQVGEVDLAGLVLAEGADPRTGLEHLRRHPAPRAVPRQRPQPARAVVAEDVDPAERGGALAAVDVAAGDRAALAVVVLGDRRGQPRAVAAVALQAVGALHDRPAVVLAAGTAGRLEVDPLVAVLPHVADVEVPRGAVEAEA